MDMKKLAISTGLLALLAALCCAAALAATSGDFTYEVLPDGTARVTAYNGTSTTVVIPDTVDGHTVTLVEHYDPEYGEAWSIFDGDENVVSITFPDTVTRIHGYGFAGCVSLKEIHLPASIKRIPYHAFIDCRSLTSIVIPEGVVEVQGAAFKGCSKLSKMWLPASLTVFPTDEGWLYYPDEDDDYHYPSGYHLTIYGYRGSLIEKIFSDYDADGHITFVARDEDIRASGDYSYLPVDGGCVITDYKGSASSLNIPSSFGGLTVVGIRDGAFARNDALECVVVPGTVRTIGNSVFERCYNLKTVKFSEGVISIGSQLFYECDQLEKVEYPASLTEIGSFPYREVYHDIISIVPRGSYAATYCMLEHIHYRYTDGEEGESLDFYASLNSDGTIKITGYCGEDEEIVIPAEICGYPVEELGNGAFSFTYDLKTVVVSEGIEAIGYAAFEGCEDLTRIVIPASVKTLGDDLFDGCDKGSLTAVVVRSSKAEAACAREGVAYRYSSFGTAGTAIPANITTIEAEAFAGCAFTSVIVPNGVTGIGAGAFKNCGKLRAILIPQGVQTLGEGIFEGCSSSLIVTVYEGSPAATYCADNRLKVVYMD